MKIAGLCSAPTPHRRYVTAFVSVAFLFLLFSGCAHAQKEPDGFDVFWKTWQAIEKQYVGRSDLDRQKMIDGAVKGLVNSLGDPHSMFRDEEETRSDQEHMTSESFVGIGAGLMIEEKVLIITSVTKGGPAEKAGCMRNDKILLINKKPTAKMTIAEAVSAIRGKEGTTVVLTIVRGNDNEKPIDISIVRGTITIPTCELEIKENGTVAHVKLHIFSILAPKRLVEISDKIESAGIKKVVLDLRGNPGGYVRSCMHIASFFLPQDALVMTEDNGHDEKNSLYSSGISGWLQNVELVVLVDKGSASTSEILAAALQHHKRAVLVGETTYGKGTEQIVMGMPKYTSLRLTVAKWLTPSGECISGKGITPDVVIELSKEDVKAGKDPQLEKALELLKNTK